MSEWKRTLASACVAFACGVGKAHAESRIVDPRAVVELVQKQNPELKAALSRLESSRQDVIGLDERYTPVIQLDGSASDVTNPSLFVKGAKGQNDFILGINRNRMRRVDYGAELRKHLIWGTDLSLRLSGNVFQQQNIRPAVMLSGTGTGTSTTPGATSSAATLFLPPTLGPGYGVVAKLTLKQPLLRGFGRDVAEAELNAARAQRTTAEYTRDRVASELVRDALGAYWELWYADSALNIQKAARTTAERQRDDARQRASTGSLAPVEVLAFETEVAAREEDVASAEAERQRAELELARLLGAEATSFGVGEEAPEGWLASSPALLEEEAVANSAEVRERAAALTLARVQARTASEPQRQRLDLDSYVQFQGLSTKNPGDAIQQYGADHAVSGFVGLTYEAPVTRRAERAAAAKARADVAAAEDDLTAVRQRVVAEARKAIERARAQERGVALAEQTRDIAERQLAAEQARFQSGTGTTLQVIQAEDKVRAAQLRVVRARADLAQTALSLAHLSGRLLSRWASR